MLEVTNATLHYGAAQALRGVSLKAGAGKITCVLGRNGVGKTSLMRSIVGHHQADDRERLPSRGRRSTGARRMIAPGRASHSCRRAGRSFRC